MNPELYTHTMTAMLNYVFLLLHSRMHLNDTTSYKNHKIPSSLIQGVDRDKTGTVSFLAESFSFVAGPVLEMETYFLQEIKWLLSECCTL